MRDETGLVQERVERWIFEVLGFEPSVYITTSYIRIIQYCLPFTCVCQTASPTPHRPEMAKNTIGASG